jgi:hypothetical protein
MPIKAVQTVLSRRRLSLSLAIVSDSLGKYLAVFQPDCSALFGGTPVIPAPVFCVPAPILLTLKLAANAVIIVLKYTIAIHDMFSIPLLRGYFDLSNDFSDMIESGSLSWAICAPACRLDLVGK